MLNLCSRLVADNIAAETYSFGMVLWCLASQQEPYTGQTLLSIRQRKLRGDRVRLKRQWGVDARFGALIRRCTDSDAASRPSFKEIVAELTAARDELDLRTVVFPH